MTYIQSYIYQIIATAIALVVFTALRYLVNSIIEKFGKRAGFAVSRTSLVKKYIDYFIYMLAILTIVSIWGIKTEQLFLFITSVLTVIGVAFFAQWSILSNITAGIIVFFSSPFKIGDTIKILDKDFPIEAKIVDIKSFYTLLKTAEGQEITLPNNLLLQKGIEIILEEEYTIKIKPN
ncbi:mechanosensitive ion channel domain-containing protein [Capnocytophaga sputigena]|uniref:mechanosensitive ion channel domain-containing protein n=1 Tax=Capnocytophaga sputigena TaxID=1019 RepID=UPI0028E23A5E|nr:mechanosensitive ion channel domain-containing protein [Capnocytophaga sputigena]